MAQNLRYRGLTALFVAVTLATILELTSCQRCENIHAVREHILVNHVLKRVADVTFVRCAVLCTEHPNCHSINHFSTTRACELNNAAKLWFPSDFVAKEGVFYMDILERQFNICVHDNPCQNGGKCVSYPNNGTFHCQCPKNYIGEKCEELQKVLLKSPGGNVSCSSQVLDLCQTNMTAWQATILGPTSLNLSSCNPDDLANTAELLLFVSRARNDNHSDYGKYQIVEIKEINGCSVTLLTPINISLSGTPCELIAQRLPYFDHISLTQSCEVTCRARSGAVGGILALRATKLTIDSTSKIQVNGKGFHGGAGGGSSGGGGFGGETFVCLSSTYGKGGDHGQTGDHGGGSGEVPNTGKGGLNAGGGGAESSGSDDGAGGGGGGGHFSGGGGGGGATGGCYVNVGGSGGIASTVIHAYAGGGGSSKCTGENGGNGGSTGAKAGNSVRGGIGGSSDNANYGGAGGGGGFQYGDVDFNTHLSYGGGGGGGGGSQFGYAGGKGGNGGGLVLLFLDQLMLNGAIEAQGSRGECAPRDVAHRGAPGGSGAGGSVVIFTKELFGSVNGNIHVQGGTPRQCARGTGGGGGGGIGRWVVKTPSTLYKSG